MIKRAAGAAVLPWLLVGLVRTLDRPNKATMSTLEIGLRDEPAHLATSLLVLLALAGPRRMLAHPTVTVTACAASMAIDVDHLPLYLDVGVDVAVDGGRPFTHSLATIGTLAGLAGASRSHRPVLAASAAGVGLHFVRDIATGHGLPLWWPWEQRNRMLPYAAYRRALVGLAALGSARCLSWALR